jgi:hypothetical protein
MAEDKKDIPMHRERLNLPDKGAAQKVTDAKRKKLRQDMAKVFGPPEGRRVLRFLMDLGGYRTIKIGGNPQLGMDVKDGTFYNASREQIVIEFLEHIPVYILKDIIFGTDQELEE